MSDSQTFWDHLDELRDILIRVIAALLLCSVAAFCFKDFIFNIILAPQDGGFVTYRLLEQAASLFGSTGSSGIADGMSVRLINTGLAHQFLIHVKTSLYVGFMVSSPYILYQLFRFVSPALYHREKRYAQWLAVCGFLMFLFGILLAYFLIFPLTFRFLGTYQVSQAIENTVTIASYLDTLITISLCMGLVFEIPVVCWIMGRLGIVNAGMMKKYRRHVVVLLLVLGAIITPTADVFTLMLVSLPMWLLYELSIHIVGSSVKPL